MRFTSLNGLRLLRQDCVEESARIVPVTQGMMRAGTLDVEHDLGALADVTFKYSHRKCILRLPNRWPLPVLHLHRVFERRPFRVACGDHEVDDIIRPQYLWRKNVRGSSPARYVSKAVASTLDSGKIVFTCFELAPVANQSRSNFSSYADRKVLLVGQQLPSMSVRVAKLLELAQIDSDSFPVSECLRKLTPMLFKDRLDVVKVSVVNQPRLDEPAGLPLSLSLLSFLPLPQPLWRHA